MNANKMITEIEAIKTMILDRFSGVDQRLTTIEQLLNKIIQTQNQTENPPTEKVMGEKGADSRAETPWVNDGLNLDGRGKRAGDPYGWVGLYTHHLDKDIPPEPAWVGPQEMDFSRRNGPSFGFRYEDTVKGQFGNNLAQGWPRTQNKVVKSGFGGKKYENNTENGWGKNVVKTGQVEIFRDSLMSDQRGIKSYWADSRAKKDTKAGQDETFKDSLKCDRWETKESLKTDAGGEKEEQMGSRAYWRKKQDDKTDVWLQDSSKTDQWCKQDSGPWGKQRYVGSDKGRYWSKKMEENTDSRNGPWVKKCDYKPRAQVVNEGTNERWKEDWGSKRKRANSPINDGPRSSGPFTATKQRVDIFSSDEQEILTDIESIMLSIQKIMHRDGYNDGDPLSPDDQTFILENVFNHHPEKARKTGAGLDYIMVNKHMKFQGSHVVSSDGGKEDFSYIKCVETFIREKYPPKADKFIAKYFRRQPGKIDHGSGPRVRLNRTNSCFSFW